MCNFQSLSPQNTSNLLGVVAERTSPATLGGLNLSKHDEADMKPNLGDVLADKYRLDRVVGEGGMSMVFAATHTLTGKQVAIKWLLPELVGDEENSQRLLREAQATGAIDHPNVVNVFDVGRHAGALFLVMEHLHGEPLSEFLTRGPHDPVEFVQLMMPILRGVHAAHRIGVVHRDLKPDNIFLCRDPHGEAREPKVLDFGISKLTDDLLEPGSELTREGTVFGTPQYMAPEQMRDAHIADARSDIYALGVIFYRAFSNEYPYDADTLTALAIRIVEGNAAPLHEICPHLDLGLCDVIMRALALDPDQRFANVAALAQALEPYADGVLFTPPTRDSWPPLRDSQPMLRASLTPRRASQPQLSQRDSRPVLTTGRSSAAPLPASMSVAPELSAEQCHDEDPTVVDLQFKAHPAHKLVGPRPSRGIDAEAPRVLPTERFPRQAKKSRRFALGAALFAIGSLAPFAYQSLHGQRESHAIAAPAHKSGIQRTSDRSALPAGAGLSSSAPTAATPHAREAAPEKGESGALPQPITEELAPPLQRGIEPPENAYVAPQPTTRRRRPARTRGVDSAETPTSAAAKDADESVPTPREDSKSAVVETERNPYLRR
jgi:eukaryotic-like serine/threonine-protein kinase